MMICSTLYVCPAHVLRSFVSIVPSGLTLRLVQFSGAGPLVVAHSHKAWVTQPGKLVIDPQNNRVSIKPFKVAVATSWQEYGGYALKKQLLPAAHAEQEIILCGDRKQIKITM